MTIEINAAKHFLSMKEQLKKSGHKYWVGIPIDEAIEISRNRITSLMWESKGIKLPNILRGR